MNKIPALVPLVSRACTRPISTSVVRNVKPDMSKIKKKQMLFQADNDIPVFLKGGSGDKVLYYITVALTFGCSANAVRLIFNEILK